MSYCRPAWAAEQRKRWLRPDWKSWLPRDTHHRVEPAPEKKPSVADDAEADAAFTAELAALQASHDRARRMLAEVKYELAWRSIVRKFSPDQPRVPAGNPHGGQWTSGAGSTASPVADDNSRPSLSDADSRQSVSGASPSTQLTQIIRICMAGSSSITTDLWGNQNYWVEYTCADGYSFKNYGLGGRFRAFIPDPRF